MANKQPLLSICIPTYNRSRFLKESLERFRLAITPDMDIEVLVSDNCSPDNTSFVVQEAINNGLKCTYVKNESNIGPDGNFLQCFRIATGKYVWLCGDDDYLIPDNFKQLYDCIVAGNYGLVALNMDKTKYNYSTKVFTDSGEFLSEIHIWITFMSGNIFRKEVVNRIKSEKYNNSYLIQVPYFLTSATLDLPNLIYYPQVLECGADSVNNGGYNPFQVFCDNLLTIITEKVYSGDITEKQFKSIKKSIYCKWMISLVIRFFVEHNLGNFNIDDAFNILKRWYGKSFYFYWFTLIVVVKSLISKYIKRILLKSVVI